MRKIIGVASMAGLALLAGCATTPDPYGIGAMLPGTMISLSDGRTLPMQIEISPMDHPSGKLKASDPAAGEQFNGTYTCILSKKLIQSSHPTLFGDESDGVAVEISDTAPCSGVLVGDKGTILNVKFTAKAGHPPIGTGDVEDNRGKKYTLQF